MSRTLVVGWDGATWSIADALCAAGALPSLVELRDGGAQGVLKSVPNMNSAPAWSTIATGLNPGRHGIFYFDEPIPGTYEHRVINATRRSGPTIWKMLSDRGKTVIVVNVPISFPAEEVRGFLVAGLDTPSKSHPGFTFPRDLPSRHPEIFEHYSVEPGAPSLIRAGRTQQAIDALSHVVEGWVGLTETLMREQDWDLTFVVFTSSDTAQHFFWREETWPVLERVYRVQDEATARLVGLARERDPDVDVIILADHGGAPNSRGPEFMRLWLEAKGLQARTSGGLRSRVLTGGFDLVNRTLTREQKLALARRFPRLRQRAESEARMAGIDWSATRAYSDGIRDEVYLNVAGREPRGQVAAADEERFAQELAEQIRGIRELETGRPVVESVRTRREAYDGPHVGRAPDLVINWVLGSPFKGFETGSAAGDRAMRERTLAPPFHPGGHHPEGLFVAKGPRIEPAAEVRGDLCDAAPTILGLLDVPVPARLDGRPLPILRGAQPEIDDSAPAEETGAEESSSSPGYTVDQEESVRKRLEDLGYL